jgi:hypothetical protein
MKKLVFILCSIIVFLIINGCASSPLDRGVYNPGNIPEEDLVTLYIPSNIVVYKINNYNNIDYTYINKHIRFRFIKIPYGNSTFEIQFSFGSVYALYPITVSCLLEKNHAYRLDTIINRRNETVSYHLYYYDDFIKGEEIPLIFVNNFMYGLFPRKNEQDQQ